MQYVTPLEILLLTEHEIFKNIIIIVPELKFAMTLKSIFHEKGLPESDKSLNLPKILVHKPCLM